MAPGMYLFITMTGLGERKRKVKRGFRTKKEAINFETEFTRKTSASLDIPLEEFVDVYFRDKKTNSKSEQSKTSVT